MLETFSLNRAFVASFALCHFCVRDPLCAGRQLEVLRLRYASLRMTRGLRLRESHSTGVLHFHSHDTNIVVKGFAFGKLADVVDDAFEKFLCRQAGVPSDGSAVAPP